MRYALRRLGLCEFEESMLDSGYKEMVFPQASAEAGAIRPGDLLTTSATPGHAMRASDRERRSGAVIGKAMGALEQGTGLVLVLVNLQ